MADFDKSRSRSNSNDKKKKKCYRLSTKFMFITWGNIAEEQCNLDSAFEELKEKCGSECEYIILCKENHKNAGRVHLHGFFYWSLKKEIRDCRAFFKLEGIKSNCSINCNKMRTSNPQNCIEYIKKYGDYKEHGVPPYQVTNQGGRASLKQKFTLKQLMELDQDAIDSLTPNLAWNYYRLKKEYSRSRTPKDPEKQTQFKHELYEWQNQLLEELLNEPAPERLIVWYHDSKGNSGKSYFANYVFANYPSRCLLLDASKKADMCYLVKPQHDWIILDITRGQEEYVDEHVYPFIEKLKDGTVFSPKYESQIIKLNKIPHVIVMANFKPQIKLLSEDRWDIRDLDLIEIPRKNIRKSYAGTNKFKRLIKSQINPAAVLPSPSCYDQQQQQQDN